MLWKPSGVSAPFSEEERHANLSADAFFDGLLRAGEILDEEREFYAEADADKDGKASRQEFLNAFEKAEDRSE